MELDRYRRGHIVFSNWYALRTSDGTTTHLIAGSSARGYKEAVGAEARFNRIYGFAQISEKSVFVADKKMNV